MLHHPETAAEKLNIAAGYAADKFTMPQLETAVDHLDDAAIAGMHEEDETAADLVSRFGPRSARIVANAAIRLHGIRKSGQ